MAKKAKKLCTWKKKDVAADFDRFADIIRNPKFVCKKCGWVSTKKMYLHKPTALKQVPNCATHNQVLWVIGYQLDRNRFEEDIHSINE